MPDVKLGDSFAQSAVLCVRPPAAFFGNGGGRTSYARNEIQMTRTSHEIYVFVLDPKHRISKLARRMSADVGFFLAGCLPDVFRAYCLQERNFPATVQRSRQYIAQCTVYSAHFTVYSAQFTVHSLQCTLYSVHPFIL